MLPSKKTILLTAASVSLGTAAMAGGPGPDHPKSNPYVAGDMHNHNTCTDGSVSAGYSIDRSVGKNVSGAPQNFDLDWFTLGNHGGSGSNDCRFSLPGKVPGTDNDHNVTWSENLNQPVKIGDFYGSATITALKGTPNGGNMWRWQSIEEIEYPYIIDRTHKYHKVLIEGLEWKAPGHEHIDVAVIAGQRPFGGPKGFGSAENMAQFEYLWNDDDTDAIGPGAWPQACADDASILANPVKDIACKDNKRNAASASGHLKSVAAVRWLQANFPLESYAVPTHTERKGPYDVTKAVDASGFNIESYREFNDVGPTVAFGIESPGHFAQGKLSTDPGVERGGSYRPALAVGGETFGGIGVYNARVGGVWDGLLGEGRNFFMFISSDWHERGLFGAASPFTTADFIPGEYSKLYVPNAKDFSSQSIVDGMRSGNSYSVNGDLIGPDMVFRARGEHGGDWKGMGETLVVKPGEKVTVEIEVSVPASNYSPYPFNNPVLLQGKGVKQPLNKPLLDHIDLIAGKITTPVKLPDDYKPGDPLPLGYAGHPAYSAGPVFIGAQPFAGSPAQDIENKIGRDAWNVTPPYNPSAYIAQTFDAKYGSKPKDGTYHLSFTTSFKAGTTPFYIRARGTNLPPGIVAPTTNAVITDSNGNPQGDTRITDIVCSDPACPDHLDKDSSGNKRVTYDVLAWSNLSFYANPIFVRPEGSPKLLVEINAEKAQHHAAHGPEFDHHGHGDHDGPHDHDVHGPVYPIGFGGHGNDGHGNDDHGNGGHDNNGHDNNGHGNDGPGNGGHGNDDHGNGGPGRH